MGSLPRLALNKFIVDSIHGDVHLTDQEWRVLDTRPVQRLRHLKQLQMGHVTYPNATHTRFSHSLGGLAVMARILQVAHDHGFKWTRRQYEDMRLAALLHDIGHYPYSHLMEHLDKVVLPEEEFGESPRRLGVEREPYPGHEQVGGIIAESQADLREAIGGPKRASGIAALFSGSQSANPQLRKLLHSSLDVDRLDYLLRDSRAAGVPYGNVDINYLLNALQVSPSGIVGFSYKALPAAEHFLLARYFMHRCVYFHKTTYGLEEACRHLLRRMRERGEVPVDGSAVRETVSGTRLGDFDDSFVDRIVHKAATDSEPVIAGLGRCIENRNPPKLLQEVIVLANPSQQHHEGTTFLTNARHQLRKLADRNGIPLGHFLFCSLKPIKLEARGSQLNEQEARELGAETEDELVKVFVPGEKEPKSLVGIPNSLISVCGGNCLRIYRLYVVFDGHDRDRVVGRLREQVSDWSRP